MNAVTQQADNSILFPAARIVMGDLYEAQTKDMQGNPLTVKSGANQGQPRVNYFFAIAIPKTPGATHFAHEQPWGAKIWALAHSWWPQGQAQQPRFSWKIEDGDSAEPNQNNRRNCDREGFPGHWIVHLGSGFAPKIFDEQGNPLLQPNLVKRGFYVETFAMLSSNNNAQKPGIYINHSMISYRPSSAKEIVSGPDPRAVGFGKSALPAGVTAQPMGNTAHMPPGVPGVPGAMPGAPAAPAMAAPPAVATPQPVVPSAGFLQPPVAGVAPAVPSAPTMAAPPAAPPASVVCPLGAPMGYKMVNLNGARYEAFKGSGWQDAQMLQAGHMVKL
jgi:hypothetical protein